MSLTDDFVDDIIAGLFPEEETTPTYSWPPPVPDPNAPRPLSKQEQRKRLRAAYGQSQRAPRQFWDPLYQRWFWG